MPADPEKSSRGMLFAPRMSRLLAQNGPSKFCGEGLMLRAERTWRGRYLRVTRVTPLAFYPEWMVQVAHQGAGAPQVHGGLGRAFARNYVRRNSLEYSGLRGEGSNPVPLPPPMTWCSLLSSSVDQPQNPQQTETF